MPFPNRSLRIGALAPMLLAATLSAGAASGPFEGYWERLDVEDPTYAGYLKVEADSGYMCIMDGKSSFRFKIRGGSITTPMNGLNPLSLASDEVLRISGTEKGESYHSDWKRMAASAYPKACVDEEREWYGGPTALPGRIGNPDRTAGRGPATGTAAWAHLAHRGDFLDALGRIRQVR